MIRWTIEPVCNHPVQMDGNYRDSATDGHFTKGPIRITLYGSQALDKHTQYHFSVHSFHKSSFGPNPTQKPMKWVTGLCQEKQGIEAKGNTQIPPPVFHHPSNPVVCIPCEWVDDAPPDARMSQWIWWSNLLTRQEFGYWAESSSTLPTSSWSTLSPWSYHPDDTMIMILTTLKISWWDDDCQRSQCLPLLGEWSFTTFPSRHPSTNTAPTFTLNQSLHTESNYTLHFSHIVHIGARWYTDRNINQMKRERSCGEWGGWAWNTASPTFTNTFANADK